MKRNKLRTLTITALSVIALVTVLAGCGGKAAKESSASAAPSGGAAEERPHVTVNVAINGGLSPLLLAREKGWLEEEFKPLNAEISWSEFQSGPPLLESLASKRVDLSFLGDGATISGLSANLPFEVIALLSDGKLSNSIIAPKAKGIAKVEDLKGKSVAVAKGTTAHVFLLKVLEKYGLSDKDVNLIALQPEDALPAFETGKVDAWVTWDPYTTKETASGKATIIAGANEGIAAPVSAIARTDFAKSNPELVTAFLKVYKKAIDWQNANTDEAVKIYADLKKIDQGVVKALLASSAPSLRAYSQEELDAQQRSSELLLSNGFIKNKVSFQDHVVSAYLEKLSQ
ncbi:aliphatic sulfonate ABC transporter substrate-binding protein [Paenibacillus glycanilyticus]|uniref:aliphatic sulfonate ABC transporter substrate-binding protein n=1 Tax=Paenibacillus glycanilyticus TaxID=126569 RepID=UPI0020423EB1|nr:aliphatic sulfonate ABC transporter substrate-binding protein [Paenibacillus glycanilyticus]MCM3629535.1 aliphatic sulfonate ABC transporter substrate-binding protein [Paenibacillus glycanilyticus]